MGVLKVVVVGAGVLDAVDFAGVGNKFALDNERFALEAKQVELLEQLQNHRQCSRSLYLVPTTKIQPMGTFSFRHGAGILRCIFRCHLHRRHRSI